MRICEKVARAVGAVIAVCIMAIPILLVAVLIKALCM